LNIDPDILYIDSFESLQQICAALGDSDWIALDTEFLREKTYYPKLCLVQIATPERVVCIDPLAIEDLAPLFELLYNERITKVMHAARQDMEIFYHLRGALPAPVFDTQIAALLLGYPDQIGYGNLVREVLDVSLDKLHTRADWSKRPLSAEQLRYAADDVVYLVQVYQQMVGKLAALGRLEWLAEDFENLTRVELYSNPPAEAWLRVRAANRLKGPALSVLQALASWREQLAQDQDRPRGWLLRDDLLIEIARHLPKSLSGLGKIRGLPERTLQKHGKRLLALVEAAREQAPQPLPKTEFRQRLSPPQEALVDVMMAVVRLSGVENELNPAVLASRKQLEQLATGNNDVEALHGWRRQLVGERLLSLLDGRLSISVVDGHIRIES
jgi:ribonuclease D